jgi:hypothetical protein
VNVLHGNFPEIDVLMMHLEGLNGKNNTHHQSHYEKEISCHETKSKCHLSIKKKEVE